MTLLRGGSLGVAVADPIDRAVVVIRHEHRAVLQDKHVDRTRYVVVVLEETRHERRDGLHGAVLVQLYDYDVAASLLGPVPRAAARNEDLVAILRREQLAGVEPHAERGRMRSHLDDRLHELVARPTPAEFQIGRASCRERV